MDPPHKMNIPHERLPLVGRLRQAGFRLGLWWPAKLLLPVGFGILGLQGIAEIIKCILALTTDYVREFAYEKPVQ